MYEIESLWASSTAAGRSEDAGDSLSRVAFTMDVASPLPGLF